uniref:CSON003548 protein n=1 Tax=Culicoides sonorensis TaxID=179676 RepID=A0A336MNQ6_CULSO
MSSIKIFKILSKFILILILSIQCNATSDRPNIIFILADDLGFNDVSFHGSSQIPTPNIDALAYSGIILNRYYVTPLCTPSRAALMTGKYPIRTGMQHDVITTMEPRGLPLKEKLLPEYLNELGYKSHIVGKWHLGHWKRAYTPLYRGFKSHVGSWTGRHDYNDHTAMASKTWGYDMRRGMNVARDLHGKYTTDIITDESIKIIKNHNLSNPLFLYIPHMAVHSVHHYNPLPAPDEVVDEMKHIEDYKRRRFAAILTILDRSVGQVVKALKTSNMLENSIIIFSTDNGGAPEGFNLNHASNWPLRGAKYKLWEGGVRGVGLIWSPLLKNLQRVSHQMIHITDWLLTLLSAAGGNVTSLPDDIDGLDLWESLSENTESPRTETLLNIDPTWKMKAMVVGDFKVVQGTNFQGKWDHWYGPAGDRDPNNYKIDQITSSYSGITLNELGFLPDEEKIRQLRIDAIIGCANATQVKCNIKNGPCLFNVVEDPCEKINLAQSNRPMLNEILQKIEYYKQFAIPPTNKADDPKGHPRFWDWTWTNWGDGKEEL